MFARFREFISTLRTKKLNLLIAGFLIGALGLTVIIAQQQTRIRQEASETPGAVTLTLSPTTATVPVGQPISVDLVLKAGTNNITGADITVNFGNAILSITQFTPSGQFNSEVTKAIDANAGTFHYVVANTDLGKQITGDITLGTLVLQPRVAGQADISLLASQIVASDATESLSVSSENGSFTVTANVSPTDTPSPTATPSPTLTIAPTNTPVPATNTPVPPTATPTITPVTGDANRDGIVDILDYNIWRDEFLGTLTTKKSDFNHDNKIDLLDFNIWRTALGSTTTSSPTPSPSTAPGASINVSPATTNKYGTLTISWTGISNPNRYDFINGGGFPTVFIQNSDGKCTVGGSVANSVLKSSGSCTLDLSNLNVGSSYTLKLYAGDPYGQELAISNSFTIDSGFKGVFVTSKNYQGNLGGLSGADSKCQERANAAGLRGTWKAWLSDSTTNARVRFPYPPSSIPYKALNGISIANNGDDLISGIIRAPINVTELRTVLDPQYTWAVWTNTLADGTKISSSQYRNCVNWTTQYSSDGSGHSYFGETGSASAKDSKWTNDITNNTTTNCPSLNKLYCFEQ